MAMSWACSSDSREATGRAEPPEGGVVLQPASSNAHARAAPHPQRGSRKDKVRTNGQELKI